MFHIANLILGLYLSWRCFGRLPINKTLKVAASLVAIAFIEHHWISSTFFRTSMPSPELPRALLLTLGVIYGALLMLALCMLIRDAIGLGVFALSRRFGRSILFSNRATIAIAAFAATASLWGTWEAVRVPSLQQVSVELPGLASEMNGYRILLLTDLHASRLLQEQWMEDVVRVSNAQKPHIIVISGDLVDGTVEDRKRDVAPLAKLFAPDGVYAVSGNHEYYADYVSWMREFKDLGIRMLENEHVIIQETMGGFVLAGVPDQVASSHGESGPDIAKALLNRPESLPVVLLDHRPGHMRANQQHGIDLQLSGHTHGGHIKGVDQVVRYFNDGFVSGMYEVAGAKLYVSNGAGLWPGFPTRVGTPSEITLITLRTPSRS